MQESAIAALGKSAPTDVNLRYEYKIFRPWCQSIMERNSFVKINLSSKSIAPSAAAPAFLCTAGPDCRDER
jgi:hypothetical protein